MAVDEPTLKRPTVRFGVFELDLKAGELHRNGFKVKLQEQPFQILRLLLEHPGELVTHDEIISTLWPNGTIVEYEHSVKTAVKKLRQALGDDADTPRYVETLPRRGYRFIYPVDVRADPFPRVGAPPSPAAVPAVPLRAPRGVSLRRWPFWLAGSLAVIVSGLAAGWFLFLRRPSQPPAEFSQTRLTFNSNENPVQSSAISPDGKYLAYSDSAGIHVKLLPTGEERIIPKPAGVPPGADWVVDSWFPDATQLLADTEEPGGRGSMWTVSVLGQSPRALRQGAWGWGVSPDGTHVAFCPEPGASGYLREIWLMGIQGDNPQKVLALQENEWIGYVRWSPDGRRLAYVRWQPKAERYRSSIETCDLTAANRTVAVPGSDVWVRDLCWLPDRRIVYSREESPGSNDDNLWQITVDGHTGTPTGEAKRLTQWAGSHLWGLSASADGKGLVLQKTTYQEQVYVGELTAGGTHMNPPRRLTNDEANNLPSAWTPDSRAVLFQSDRNGTFGIFKQGISQETAEPVFTAPQGAILPRLSSDNAWILYADWPKTFGPSTPFRVMRIPVGGGMPEFVMEVRNWNDYRCAHAPVKLCVVSETSQDEKQLTLTAFEPLKGRGKALRTIQTNVTASLGGADISPDGTTYAMSKSGESEIHIRLLSLSGGSDREITVNGWPNLTGLDWSPDGKALYVGSRSARARTLLYVDLKGNARVLWQLKGTGGDIFGVPSPDGRSLAIHGDAENSNAWVLEGF